MTEARSYPIILIPDRIQVAKSQVPQLPEFKLSQPEDPGPKPEVIKKRVVTTQSAIAVVPGVMVASHPKARIAGFGLMAAALMAIAVQTWRKVVQNKQRQTAHQQFHHEMAIYQDESRRYEMKCVEAIATFQMKLVLQILREACPPDEGNSRARRGWSEANFREHLELYFPGQIRTGEAIYRPGTRRYPYTPDFIYHDERSGLYVDIEIDEPYVYNTVIATHFIGNAKDERRNQWILERGWVIVRFSEEQVVRWPERCCKTVAEAIAGLLGHDVLEPLAQVADLPERPCWTEEEAIAMAEQASRQEYLKRA